MCVSGWQSELVCPTRPAGGMASCCCPCDRRVPRLNAGQRCLWRKCRPERATQQETPARAHWCLSRKWSSRCSPLRGGRGGQASCEQKIDAARERGATEAAKRDCHNQVHRLMARAKPLDMPGVPHDLGGPVLGLAPGWAATLTWCVQWGPGGERWQSQTSRRCLATAGQLSSPAGEQRAQQRGGRGGRLHLAGSGLRLRRSVLAPGVRQRMGQMAAHSVPRVLGGPTAPGGWGATARRARH